MGLRARLPRIVIFAIAAGGAACTSGLSRSKILAFEGFGGAREAPRVFLDAEAALAAGRVDEAIALATALRSAWPDNILVHRLYQNALIAAGRRDDARTEYIQIAEKWPSALTLTLLSRLQDDPADGIAKAIHARDYDDQFPWAWYAQGWWHARQPNKSKEAIECFRTAMILNPDFFEAVRAFAILEKERDPAAATEAIARYVKTHPGRREERLLLSALRLYMNDFKNAERDLRELVAEDQNDAGSAIWLAAALVNLGAHAEARSIYERLNARNPGDPLPELNLGILAEVYENDPQRAIEHYKSFLTRSDGQPFLYQTRARLWLQELEQKLAAKAESASKPDSASKPAAEIPDKP